MKRVTGPWALLFLFGLGSCTARTPWVTQDKPGWSLARGVFETNGFYRDVALGDVNNDGYLDIIAGNTKIGGVNIWLSQDEGSRMDLSMSIRSNLIVDTLEVGDVNSDGWNDIVVSPSGRGVEQLINGRDGTWYSSGFLASGGSYSVLRSADLNGDGAIDLIGCNFIYREQIGGIQVWLNTGKGRFDKDTGPSSTGQCRDAVVTDVDGDGHQDIVAAFWGPVSSVRVWRGDGRGGWWAYPNNLDVEKGIWSIAAADLDNDGREEVLLSLYPNSGLVTAKLAADGTWSWGETIVGEGNYWKIWAGDLDGNGQTDLLASSHTGQGLRRWEYDGGWEFRDEGLPGKGDFYGFRVGDLNGDGAAEIVAATLGEGIRVWSLGDKKESLFGATGKKSILPVDTASLELESTVELGDYRRAPMETTIVIYFDHSEAGLSAQAKAALDYVVTFVKKHAGATIELVGHAEPDAQMEGEIDSLEKLSQLRAGEVAKYLMDGGIDRDRITLKGVGEVVPISPVPEANRAVEVVIHVPEEEGPKTTSGETSGEAEPTGKKPPVREGHPYVIGPGDGLAITLWQRGKPEAFAVTVHADGTISFLFLRDVPVAGLSVKQVIRALETELRRYYKEPLVDVEVTNYQSQQVLVIGAIGGVEGRAASKIVPLTKATRIVEILANAGGPSPDADLKNVSLSTSEGQTQYVNLYQVLFEGDQSQNVYISPGDVIFLPSMAQSFQRVYVFGAVGSAGSYPVREGMRLLDALADAGGHVVGVASLSRVGVLRMSLESPKIITVNVDRLIREGDITQNILLQNRDIIFVPRYKIYSVSQWISVFSGLVTSALLPVTSLSTLDSIGVIDLGN